MRLFESISSRRSAMRPAYGRCAVSMPNAITGEVGGCDGASSRVLDALCRAPQTHVRAKRDDGRDEREAKPQEWIRTDLQPVGTKRLTL